MFKIPNKNCFGYLSLGFGVYLEFEIWYLEFNF